jgi:hypothetical protein
LLLSNLIVNQFRDDEDKFTAIELVGTTVITCLLFGLYFLAASQINTLFYFQQFAFYAIFFFVFRPDSIIEGIAIIVLSMVIFLVLSWPLATYSQYLLG